VSPLHHAGGRSKLTEQKNKTTSKLETFFLPIESRKGGARDRQKKKNKSTPALIRGKKFTRCQRASFRPDRMVEETKKGFAQKHRKAVGENRKVTHGTEGDKSTRNLKSLWTLECVGKARGVKGT